MEQEQLTLNLQIRPAPSLDNFAVGDNAELVSVLRTMAETGSGPQFLYLWGETGVGCTHLLHAMDPLAGVERVPAFSESRLIYTVDDVEELGEDAQQKLFELMNDVRSHSDGGPFGQYRLITAGDLPPLQMKGRPDVISRLSWGLVFQVHPLTDEQKDAALRKLAEESRIDLPDDVDAGTPSPRYGNAFRSALRSGALCARSFKKDHPYSAASVFSSKEHRCA